MSKVPCSSYVDCKDPYGDCVQSFPGAFSEPSATRITVAGAIDGQCLNDGAVHAADLAGFVCMPPLFNQIDLWFGLPGPATSVVSGSVQLSP